MATEADGARSDATCFPELPMRFRGVRLLGSGGMGSVYEVIDTETNEPVALKTTRAADSESVYRLKREFRALADVRHTNLVQFHEMLSFRGAWFFTMDLVRGIDFLRYCRSGPLASASQNRPTWRPPTPGSEPRAPSVRVTFGDTVDNDRLRESLRQLVDGIAALHERGIIHCDIKPSNVLVESTGRVKILDFGIVTRTAEGQTRSDLIGTAAYIAPELAAGTQPTFAADWYSLGVLLYHVLTGREPFAGPPTKVLRDKQLHAPRTPHEFVSGIPDDLVSLCLGLLAPTPSDRPTAEAILDRLGGSSGADGASTMVTTKLVGRESELEAMMSAADEVAGGRDATVVVEGPSGIGKTALTTHFLDVLRVEKLPDAWILAGRCHERELIPFRALDMVVDSLAVHLKRIDQVDLAMMLPPDTALVARLFPVLARVPAIARSAHPPAADESRVRAIAVVALRSLLQRLSVIHPIVIAIDDAQWADADSLSLLRDLLRRPGAPRVLLVLTIRSGLDGSEREDVHASVGWPSSAQRIPLGNLAFDAASLLARRVLRDADPESAVASDVARASSGHPMFIQELAQFATAHPRASECLSLETLLWSRISRLEDPERDLLQLVALVGEPIDPAIVLDAASSLRSQAAHHLQSLCEQRLVRFVGQRSAPRVECYHDRVREVVLEHVPTDMSREMHASLARVISRDPAVSPRVLIRHLAESGRVKEAALQAVAVAAQLRGAYAYEQAAHLLRFAVQSGIFSGPERARLNGERGDCLAFVGRGHEAAEAYRSASSESGNRTAELNYTRLAAEQLLFSGFVHDGMLTMSGLARHAGVRWPTSTKSAYRRLVQVQRTPLPIPGACNERQSSQSRTVAANRLMSRFDTLMSAGVGMCMLHPIRGAMFHARALRVAVELGEPNRLCRAFAYEAAFAAARGERADAERAIHRARELSERLNEPLLHGVVLMCSGLVHHTLGDVASAIASHAASLEYFERCRMSGGFEGTTARISLLNCLRQVGRFGEMGARMRAYLADAVRWGNRYASMSYRTANNIVWLCQGETDEARRQLRIDPISQEDGFLMQHWYGFRARLEEALFSGDATEVLREAPEAFRAMDHGCFTLMPSFAAETAFFKGRVALLRAGGGRNRPGALREVMTQADVIEGSRMRFARAWAPLLRAGVALRLGQTEGVVRELFVALMFAETEGLKLPAAAAHCGLADVMNGAEGKSHRERGHTMLQEEGVVDPERLANTLYPRP